MKTYGFKKAILNYFKEYSSKLIFILLIALTYITIDDLHLNYSFNKVIGGEYWRVITNTFSHQNITHLFTNLLGFFILTIIFPQSFLKNNWLIKILLIGVLINITVLFVYQSSFIYSGLSGSLYGLALLVSLENKDKVFGKLLIVLITLKLAIDHWYGGASYKIEGTLIFYQSHSLGAIWGTFIYLLEKLYKRLNSRVG